MKTKRILKIIFTISICFLIFTLSSFFYLQKSLNTKRSTDIKNSSVPYTALPDNCGVLFILPDNSGVLIYLEFSQNLITGVLVEEYSQSKGIYYGYPADYRIEGDYSLLAGIIDNAGGITLTLKDEERRFTGVQIIELLSFTEDFKGLFKEILKALFVSISKNGFSNSDIIYILENAAYSTLTLPECLNWDDYIQKMSKSAQII